jgi:DNA repair exonuclease SbcCD ATPase subunit
MIPQRIKLSGFLSYKEEQEIRFDESPLWMLTGINGSGKSSIFDAVTFALFGHHRGGSQSAAELINKESSTLSVEFDFTVERQLYRIKRTVRRRNTGVASTQQVLKHVKGKKSLLASAPPAPASSENGQSDEEPLDNLADEEWEALPDTNYKAKFDAWVKDRIGLDYETFTSSVLLLQGKSEKLLDSTPAGRAGVLARIVDLERYQKLHGRCDDRRRELKGQLEGLSNQLAGTREVSDEELGEASARIEDAAKARMAMDERIAAMVTTEIQALRWTETCSRLAVTQAKLTTAEGLLGNAVAIEKEYARLRELRDVLPAVGTIVTERGRISESERSTLKLFREREETADRRRQVENALDQSQKKVKALKKTLTEDEAKLEVLNRRLRELGVVLEKVKQVEESQAEVERLEQELAPLPTDAEGTVKNLQQECERLALLEQHVALLESLHRDRSELTKAVAAEKKAREAEAKVLADGKKAKEEMDGLQARIKEVRDARRKADEAVAETRALARQARELAKEFQQHSGAKTCRSCGQPLTIAHFESEKKKREAEAQSAEKKLETLTKAAAKSAAEEEALTKKEETQREQLEKLRDGYKDASSAVKQLEKDIKRLIDACRRSYFALPDEFKQKIGDREPDDWSTALYPDRVEITRLNKEVQRLDDTRRKLKQAQADARKVQSLRAKLESAREGLTRARQGVHSGDAAAIRQEHKGKQGEEQAVTGNIKATKAEIERTEKDVERQQRELGNIDTTLTELTGKLNLEESTRAHSTEAIERAKKTLPTQWQKPVESAGFNEQLRWKEEHESLINRATEARYTQLQAARGGLDSLRAEIRQYQDEADAFPAEARRSPEEIKREIAAARSELEERNKQLLAAQRQKGILDDHRRQRDELNAKYKSVDASHNRYKTLAELLGRDRLQRFLVRQAEKQIVDYANSVLDRLSGGQLFLRLVGTDEGSSEKALELECSNRVTGGAAINVAFLSGSQRFRVAVALALGIGQYASKQHRPIESVIIDEGFGCLDRAGRQVMIQELQNLRGQLQCILLVSHQEEFADAFPDGYRFELRNGATRVSRFAR